MRLPIMDHLAVGILKHFQQCEGLEQTIGAPTFTNMQVLCAPTASSALRKDVGSVNPAPSLHSFLDWASRQFAKGPQAKFPPPRHHRLPRFLDQAISERLHDGR